MRHAFGLLGVAAASVLLLVSAAMNWQYGFELGKTEFNGLVLGMASAASDGMKALLPFFLFAAIKDQKWSHAMACGLLWIVTVAFSLTSALGFASLNRADTASARAAEVQSYKDVRVEMTRLRDRLSWVPEHRPAGTVAGEMETLKKDRKWSRTEGCTDATRADSRAFCKGYHALGAELAAATEANKLETRIRELKGELAKSSKDLSTTQADPQAETLASLFGQHIETVQIGLVILVAILVERGSSLGFYVAFGQWRIYEDRRSVMVARPRTRATANDNAEGAAPAKPAMPAPQLGANKVAPQLSAPVAPQLAAAQMSSQQSEQAPVAAPQAPAAAQAAVASEQVRKTAMVKPAAQLTAPENDVERFFRERVSEAEGCTLTATALYEDYCEWCDEHAKEPLALPTFGRQFGEVGVRKAKIQGRIRYIGVKLNSGRADGENVPLAKAA
ncbi:MAG: hypothetical protein AAFO79_06295 [Pseudomonadota bacterium]